MSSRVGAVLGTHPVVAADAGLGVVMELNLLAPRSNLSAGVRQHDRSFGECGQHTDTPRPAPGERDGQLCGT